MSNYLGTHSNYGGFLHINAKHQIEIIQFDETKVCKSFLIPNHSGERFSYPSDQLPKPLPLPPERTLSRFHSRSNTAPPNLVKQRSLTILHKGTIGEKGTADFQGIIALY